MSGGASAPGKALLSGEYAVLDGAPAIVAAVSRRVDVRWAEKAMAPLAAEVEATLEIATRAFGAAPSPIEIDVRSLYEGERKLGLGSSAAAAVAAAGAVMAHHGHDLATRASKDAVFRSAFEGHAAVAPSGSGVDVASSTYGGFLRFIRSGNRPEVQPVARLEGLEIALVWTGHPARTSDLIGAVHRFRDHDPGAYAKLIDSLKQQAGRFAEAFAQGRASQVVEVADAYGEAMQALGNASGAPIVDGALERARSLARSHGGAAKPSGAGGGDVAVAFFEEKGAMDRFREACRGAGLLPVDVTWGVEGVRPEP